MIRVLLVEDQPLIRLLIAESLSDEGLEVVEAGNGAQAIKHLDENDEFDLVITDIQMPGEADGNIVAKEAKAKFDLPVIYMTGNPSSVTQRLGLRDALMAKPFSPRDLIVVVQRLFPPK